MAFQIRSNTPKTIEELEKSILLESVAKSIVDHLQSILEIMPDDWEDIEHRVNRKILSRMKNVWK